MKHIDSVAHVRGESHYVDDMPRPSGLLYGFVLGSPVARGRLESIDVEAAAAMPGVVRIFTADDIPGLNQIGPIIQDETLLAEGRLCYQGEPLALVLAEDSGSGRRALDRIELAYQEEDPIVDPKEAYRRGEIIGAPRTFRLGDVEKAWADCDLVVEGSCDIGGQEHVYLETQRARAIPLESGGVLIWSSTQGPYAVQRASARILGISENLVEVDVKRLGGGFGGKEDQATAWACLAALGARLSGRPVEIVLGRSDDLRMTGKRHPYLCDFKMGLDSQGRILAYVVRHYQNSGAFADLSTAVLERTLFHSTNAYFVPNVEIFAVCCRTNLPSNTAFRGFGGPQGMFVIESAIAQAAEAMNRPREDIQRINLLKDGDIFPYGQAVCRSRARRSWREAAEGYDLEGLRTRIERFNQAHAIQKKGLAMMPICFGISFTAIQKNQAGALVHIYTDGSVAVTTGGVEMGQGLSTNVALVTARALGIDPGRVKVEATNTTRIANMSPSAASATTLLNGNAALIAAQAIRENLLETARERLGPGEIEIRDEKVFKDGEESALSWTQLVQATYDARRALSSHGFFATPDIHFDKEREQGRPFAYHAYGTAIVEVTLDCLRGVYEIDSVKIVHDVGHPLSPEVDLGQIEGGLAQGLGWMTLEELRYDRRGRLLSSALATYKVPDVYFMPDDIQVRFMESEPEDLGPYGSKAVGEPPLLYGIAAFFALRDAMRAFRVRDYPFVAPLTPERVLMQTHAEEAALLREASRSKIGTVPS